MLLVVGQELLTYLWQIYVPPKVVNWRFMSCRHSALTSFREQERRRVVLVTGATGFIGRVLLYKLLTACPDIAKVILLLRPRGTESCADRLANLLSAPVSTFLMFGSKEPPIIPLHHELANIPRDKVTYIAGDLTEPGLGIGAEDLRRLLSSQVSVAFHIAASVKFDDPLRKALETNFFSALALALVIVSTAFAFFPRKEVGEEVYSVPVNLKGVQDIASLDLQHLEKIRKEGHWVNTYTFSKALLENAVQQNNTLLRIAIVRPSIVLNAWKEPLPGWINNISGPLRILRGLFLGHVRAILFDGRKTADIVPVDLCVNSLIAVAKETAEHGERGGCKVYNFISGTRNRIAWREYWSQCSKQIHRFPALHAQWYNFYVRTKFWTLYYVMWFCLELIPACIVHLTSPKHRRKIGQTLGSLRYMQLVGHFATNECKFEDANTRSLLAKLSPHDRTIFNFDILQVDWAEYLADCVKGMRLHILKEGSSTLPSARNRHKRLFALHCTVMMGALYVGYKAMSSAL
ncbi:putative fatty acyl-CoA reductase [Blattella germanica]|nr:putative fatty acyl-CoA reductase [Blattella germanica]